MLTFRLQSSILIGRSLEEIPRFFADPRSLQAWDTSVAKVEPTCEGPLRVGYTFDTIGPSKRGRAGMRSSYRVTKLEPTINEVELVGSRVFTRAVWTFKYSRVEGGTLTVCIVEATVRARYILLALLLRLNKRALLGDLQRLKLAIESYSAPGVAR